MSGICPSNSDADNQRMFQPKNILVEGNHSCICTVEEERQSLKKSTGRASISTLEVMMF